MAKVHNNGAILESVIYDEVTAEEREDLNSEIDLQQVSI